MPVLTKDNINQAIINASYEVRGTLVQRASEIEKEGFENRPYKEIIYCNIGNPQNLGQQPISFVRNVLACLTQPKLLETNVFPKDVIERAKEIIKELPCGNLGGYSHSQGLRFVRQHVAEFIEERDGIKTDPDSIYLGNGASDCISKVLNILIRDKRDGIMVHIPQYPLYSAAITLFGGSRVDVNMDFNKGFALTVEELERAYKDAVSKNITPRALVVINPGNPTGCVLKYDNMKEIVQFCMDKNLVLLADEVYQSNIYKDNPFISFKKVVHDMKLEDKLELFSFHSVSKGFLGECGRRGGYMEISPAVNKDVRAQIYKLFSISLCANLDGQIVVDVMVKPPKEGDESYEEYKKERDAILASLKRRSETLVEAFNSFEGVKCNPAEGAMYCYPRITISQKAVDEAKKRNLKPDTFYCLELLESTGICCVPGSGFGNELESDNSFYFRTTFLPAEDKLKEAAEKFRIFHSEFMKKYPLQ